MRKIPFKLYAQTLGAIFSFLAMVACTTLQAAATPSLQADGTIQPPGSIHPINKMQTARAAHTATLLQN